MILNLVSAVAGDNGKFLRSEYWTYKETSPQVYLLATENHKNAEVVQNFLLVALKHDNQPSFISTEKDFCFLFHSNNPILVLVLLAPLSSSI